MNLRRAVFLTHRWSAIVLGVFVFTWFVSGIAMMYYPWPFLTESRQRALLEPFELGPADTANIGFREAATRVRGAEVVGGRLVHRGGALLYELWDEAGGRSEPAALIDARTGESLTPLTRDRAISLARGIGERANVSDVDLLERGDQYMLSHEYAHYFPAWRVRFADAAGTAVYVSRDRGTVFGEVTTRTRVITWIGVVPHWLYFPWLYRHLGVWTWICILLPAAALLIAVTGITHGVTQIIPRRRDGIWEWHRYRGVSQWHHFAGVVFGVLVLTWTLSGVLEMFGSGNEPVAGQARAIRGGQFEWSALLLREPGAYFVARSAGWMSDSVPRGVPGAQKAQSSVPIVSITLSQMQGLAGYDFQFVGGRELWVDASTGAAREELEPTQVALAALSVFPRATVTSAARLTHYDAYYYARHGRELHLPVWRVGFNDPERSVLYLNTMTGAPAGFVDKSSRRWRWWRDGLHSLDFPRINGRRPLWDAIMLPLLLGGALIATTGMWLVIRRLRQMNG